jgi:hypothetical protein
MQVYKLILSDNKWKFVDEFPPHYKIKYGKDRKSLLSTQIWFKNQKTYMVTSMKKDKIEPIPKKNLKGIMPKGFSLVKIDTTKTILNRIYESLHKLFSIKDPKLMITDFGGNYGIFRKKTEAFNATDALPLVKKYDEFLYYYFLKIILKIKKIYDNENIPLKEFITKYVSLTVNKYKDNNGLGFHTDNIIRYNTEGPICVISIGPENSFIDFAPSISYKDDDKLIPLRIKLPEGNMYIMDGESRLTWSHAIPYDNDFNKTKFSILFKCSRFPNFKVSQHNQIFDTDIYESIKK